MNGNFYSVEEFADKLGMHPQTIRRAIKAKRIHAFRPGIGIKSPFRIYESELQRVMLADFQSIKKAIIL